MTNMRRSLMGVGLVAVLAVGVVGCSSDAGQGINQVAETTGQTTVKPEPPAFSVKDEETDVEPLDPITVKSEAGLEEVEMTNEDGKVIESSFNDDHTEWEVTEPLGYGRYYTIVAKDKAGQKKTVSFSTVVPAATTNVYMGPLEGSTVGVAQAITFRFDVPIQDTKALEELIDIETSNDTEGGFFWLDPYELRWRPKEFWEPGTTVKVTADLYGKDLGGGVYGAQDNETTFEIGDEVKTVIDNNEKVLRVYQNGEQIRSFPVSLGTDFQYDTPNGTYVVGDEHTSLVMDSRTFGLGLGQGGYVTPVDYATQLSYSGIYVHSAPWAVWAMGATNQSHGCVNATYADAQWFQETVKRGDPVVVKNTNGGTLNGYDGLGYWNLDWEQRSGGSKDPNA